MSENGWSASASSPAVSTLNRRELADNRQLSVVSNPSTSWIATSSTAKATLHDLAASGTEETFSKRLAKATIDELNLRDDNGRTPLHCAVENDREAIVEMLCQNRLIDTTLRDDHKRTPLHLAVITGQKNLVEMVLSISREVDHVGPNDRTPLHMAARRGYPEIARLLLQHGANPLNKDKRDMTPVGIAAVTGSLAILDAFFSTAGRSSSLDLLESTSGPEKSSLLHLAAESGSPEAVVYLLYKNINRHSRDANGCTAVHRASQSGMLPVLRHLATTDNLLFDSPSSEGLTPVHEAAMYDQVHVVEFLLQKGARPDSVSNTGISPLLAAATFGAHNAVRLLLCHKVDCLKKDNTGANVVHCAVGHIVTLKVLAEILEPRGVFEELLHGQDEVGATALHHAAHHGRTSDVTFLIEHGARLDVVNHNGLAPLHVAARQGKLEIVTKLSSCAPFTLHTADICGRTPLHIASFYGHTKVVQKLLSNGAGITQDNDGRTQLHYSAWHGGVDCMKVLVSNSRTALNTVDLQKATPLHLAVVADHPDMVEYLLDQEITLITDNDFGQNALDVAIALDKEKCASKIIKHARWEKSMKPLGSSSKTQLQLLVEKMPVLAVAVMDKSVVTSVKKKTTKRKFDFRYINGVTDQDAPIQGTAPPELLKAMVKFKRTSCMAHSLCVEFLNSKWRKFGAAVVIANLAVYLLFLLLLMALVIDFPTYSESPLCHIENAQRLIRILQPLNSTVTVPGTNPTLNLTLSQKMEFCYGNYALRMAVVASVFLCLLKETVPMFYQGLDYFVRPSNVFEMAVYILTLTFLDPFGFIIESLNVPVEPCPKAVWEVGAMAVFLSWLVLLLNLRRLPVFGIYIVMLLSMIKTLIEVVVVVSLFILAFGLAFYMLMNNEKAFHKGGLSLMKVVVMSVGDLAYESLLIPREENFNVTPHIAQLKLEYSRYTFVNSPAIDQRCLKDITCPADSDEEILFPALSYSIFIVFMVLMPIVVLNVLIGLAVGDIAVVQADAALRQIRMQIKLLVQLETALPSWLLSHVQVPYSVQSTEEEKTLRRWIRHVTRAADEPNADEKSPYAEQLTEIKQNLLQLNNWLSGIQTGLDQHTILLKSLAICVRHQMKQDLKAVSSQLDVRESSHEQVAIEEQVAQPTPGPSVLSALPPVTEAAEDEDV